MERIIRYSFLLFFFGLFSSTLKAEVKFNRNVELLYKQTGDSTCRQNQCGIFLHVIKAKQKLYLYQDGTLVDSFKVSTGNKKHPTPDIDMSPKGPTFVKYTSRKYPGGDYKGLGNMPYVVFIKGGYGIHGTTPGNFLKLGHRASHGCIRVHPTNAKKIFDLVNLYGLENTWVTVE